MIAVVLQVPLVNGQPDVDLPATIRVRKEERVYTMYHLPSGEMATFKFLGTTGGNAVLAGMATAQVATWLVRQGITVTRIRDATQAQKDWLAARGVTAQSAGHTFSGWSAGDTDA